MDNEAFLVDKSRISVAEFVASHADFAAKTADLVANHADFVVFLRILWRNALETPATLRKLVAYKL